MTTADAGVAQEQKRVQRRTRLIICPVGAVARLQLDNMSGVPWLYLGKDLEKREAVGRRLGEKGLLDLGGRLHEAAETLRQPFLDFIAALGRIQEDRFGWWASTCSWKEAGASDLFLLVCYQHMVTCLERARQVNEPPLVLVIEDPWLLRQLKEALTGKGGVEFHGTAPLWPLCLQAMALGLVARVVWALRLAKNYLLQAWFWTCQEPAIPPRLKVGIYSPPQARSLAKPDGWIDPYLGNLSALLEKAGYTVLRFCPPEMGGFERALGQRSQYFRPLILSITVSGVLRALFATWRPRWPSPSEVAGQPVHWLLRREWWKDRWRSSYFLFRVFSQCMLKLLESEQFAALIYPYENQPWEKLLVLNARSCGVGTIGYYHSAGLARFTLSFFHGAGESDYHPLPDLIVTSGSYAQELLRTGGTPSDRLVMGGSLRFQYLLTDDEPVPIASSGETVKVLVALPLDGTLARHLLHALRRAFPDGGRAEGIEFSVKLHPVGSITEKSIQWPAAVLPGRFVDVLRPCHIVIYSGSSTGLEALALRRRVIRYRSELLLDLDVAALIGGHDIVDCSDHDLRTTLLSVARTPAPSSEKEWSESLKRIFSPVKESVWLECIDRLTRQRTKDQNGRATNV